MAKITPVKPFVLMLYGFPGAGKTYFARQFAERVQIAHLQADRIRAELFEEPRYDRQENEVVFQLMNYMTGEFLAAGISVIYDVNMLRSGQRRALRDLSAKAGAQSLLVWFQLDPDTAFTRSQKRDRRRVDDRYAAQIDKATFENIASNMQNPTNKEDYVVVSGKHLFGTQFSAVVSRLRERKVFSLDDTGLHMPKPELVNRVPNPAAGRVDLSRRNIIIR